MPPCFGEMNVPGADTSAGWTMDLGIFTHLNEEVDGLLFIAYFDHVHTKRCMDFQEVLEQLLNYHPAL